MTSKHIDHLETAQRLLYRVREYMSDSHMTLPPSFEADMSSVQASIGIVLSDLLALHKVELKNQREALKLPPMKGQG